MENKMKWVDNHMPKTEDKNLSIMSIDNVKAARAFHVSFPQYTVTPLVSLQGMANRLGLGGLYVKDESYRFGLNAFKVLGGSFAIAKCIAEEMGKDISEMNFEYLTSKEFRDAYPQATFYTATDGNHGKGIAWAANRLGQKAVVRMPKGTTPRRYHSIAAEGADVTIEELNYDDCVRKAAREAAESEHGIMVQDTAWEGYEKIPSWIMQGYGTMADEVLQQFDAMSMTRPTHVFVQAGVGSLAAAVVGYLYNVYKDNPPKFIIMEAESAACLYKGAEAGDGEPRKVGGDMPTIMAGLACGEPNTIGWDILRNHVSAFIAAQNSVAARGMRMFAVPVKGDTVIISGESGAIGMGVVSNIMEKEEYKDLKEYLGLGKDSKVLLFSTEGNTDPDRFRDAVWDGAYNDLEGNANK